MSHPAAERLIVALDVSTARAALDLVELLGKEVRWFKVGLQLFVACGPQVVRRIRERGAEVFLDLKAHDIPNTVAAALVEAGRHGAGMVTLHALGGERMLEEARTRVQETARREGWAPPRLLGITLLTSLTEEELRGLGLVQSLGDEVLQLARLAARARLDGIVCSPRDLSLLQESSLRDLFKVTPGVRPAGAASQDQSRVASPAEAIRWGADYLVVGRPITGAPDPLEATRRILREMEAGSSPTPEGPELE